jgi:hypothetical protein
MTNIALVILHYFVTGLKSNLQFLPVEELVSDAVFLQFSQRGIEINFVKLFSMEIAAV